MFLIHLTFYIHFISDLTRLIRKQSRSDPNYVCHCLLTSDLQSPTWLARALTSPLLKSSSTIRISLGVSTAASAASMMGVYPALFCWFTLHTSETHTSCFTEGILWNHGWSWWDSHGLTVIDLSPSPLSLNNTMYQHLARDASNTSNTDTDSWDDALSHPSRTRPTFFASRLFRDPTSSWQRESGQEWGGYQGDCSATEERRGLRNWDGGKTKATMGTWGWICCHTKGRGDKKLLEQRAAGTSSHSIEPSEKSQHGCLEEGCMWVWRELAQVHYKTSSFCS